MKLARRLLRSSSEMFAVGRMLLWTVALLAPGGFLLLPVLFALRARAQAGEPSAPPAAWSERLARVSGWLKRRPVHGLT